ncbi:MAG: C25 family cysteine peptidase [Candidatus Electryonea clarkiae]|nr:C25 family cysteine peptidase [Candidatus Electryonea clarkiae]MDP8285732.1 C25 family cysteine peptidase [Candidatus Electryonea clarkiae]
MKFFSLTAILLLAMVFSTFAATVIDAVSEEYLPMTVESKVITDDGMTLDLAFSTTAIIDVGQKDNQLSMVELESGNLFMTEGYPIVPVAGRMFRIPPRSGMRLEIVEADYEVYSDIDYATYTGSDDPLDMVKNPNPVDEWYPAEIASIGEPARFGDFRVGNLVTYPVQVNTARREVRVYTNLQVTVHYEGNDETNALPHWPTKISEAKLPLYKLFLDWDDSELDEYTLYRGGVQVVMRDSQNLMNLMQPWFEWKLQRGWEIELLTSDDVAWTNNAIRAELIDRYEDAETPFDYVVIIGDDQGTYSTPSGSGGGYGAGDEPYARLAGNDQLSDVGIGRISIRDDNQLRIYINKVLSYERDPDLDNTGWYGRAMVNVSDNHTGNTKMMMLRYVRHACLDIGYTTVDTSWRIGNTRAIQKFNAGISFYGARGYINSGLSAANIAGLNNSFMTPVVVDVTCSTGDWSGGDDNSEAYMRAGTVNSPRGGICGFGMATSATSVEYNHVMSAGAYWGLLNLRMLTLGDMKLTSTFNGYSNYETQSNTTWRQWAQRFNLMGDPTVWPWTTVPAVIEVTAEDEIELGQNNYDVTAEDEDGNPIERAWVTLYKVDDDEQIISRGLTDSDGFVSLDIPVRYSGEAVLTVSKQHFAPTQIDVDVTSPTRRVGYLDITVIDDGNNDTEGNDNGIPEAGETVGLQILAKNFGTLQETNVSFTASSEDDWITDIEGEVTFNSLNAGQTATGNDLILVEISPETQHDYVIHIDLEIDTDVRTFNDSYPMTVMAPQFVMVEATSDDDFDPGETVELDVELINVGGSNADAATGELISHEPFVRVTTAESDFDAMDVEETATGTFEIMLHSETIVGYIARLDLILTTESGQVDTVNVSFQLGEKSSTDPSGPDSYGYYAFDNTDDGYDDYVPTFDWVEINPDANDPDFDGDELDLSDPSENQDESITIDLPFTIHYYGEEFDEATVCTNGWIAMGSQADMAHPRNWTIPAPDGPNYMIAAYWDDLRLSGGAGVYTYHDRPNGRFIIEWYNVTTGGQSNRFEIIFYSLQARPTYTQDNDFIFQYDDTGHSSNSMQYDVPYWTTGIENGNQDGGLLYHYYGNPAPGGVSRNDFSDGLVILFSTNVALITGTLQGTVIDLATGDPMEDMLVYTTDTLYSAITDEDGFYLFEEHPIGEWDLYIELDCYNPISEMGILVEEDDTTIVDFEMRYPEIGLDPVEIDEDLTDVDELLFPVELSNTGNGYLNYTTKVYLQDPRENPRFGDFRRDDSDLDELDDLLMPWDFAASYDIESEETRNRGIVFIDRFFYVSGSDNFDPIGPNKIYQFSRYDAELIDTFDQPVPEENRSAQGFYGLAWDGSYLYGVDNGTIYQMDLNPTLGGSDGSIELNDSWEIPFADSRYLAYDSDQDLFWTGDINSNVFAFDREGELVHEYEQNFSPRGLGWYPDDEIGYNLYFTCRATANLTTSMIRMDPETGDTETLFQYETPDDGLIVTAADVSGSWHPLIWTLVTLLDDGPDDVIQLWVINANSSFFEILNPSGTVEGETELDVDFVFRGTDLPIGEYPFFVEFLNNACEEENNFVSVVMSVPDTIDEVATETFLQPLEWAFKGAYPNPFNPTVNVSFSLKSNVMVNARVFNLLGQEVAVLADYQMKAGNHSLTFDGADLASGMYFLQFNAGPLSEMKKLILMK